MLTIDEKVHEIIARELRVEKDEVTSASSFEVDLRVNSFDVIELLLAFEQDFDIEIPDVDVLRIRTVGDAIDCIHRLGGSVSNHGILREQT